MRYTQNHHLPQWEESDRVLMQDFNTAMANIETGLLETKPLAWAAENMARDLYRQAIQQAVHHGGCGLTDSMWINPLTTRAEAGGDGHGWNGRYGVCLGGGNLPTVEGIKSTAKELTYLNTTTYNTREPVGRTEFISDGYGTMETVTVWSSWSQGPDYPAYIALFRTDTGEQVGQAGPFICRYDFNTAYPLTVCPVNFPLEANTPYRLELTMDPASTTEVRAGFPLQSAYYKGDAVPMTIVPRAAEPSVTHTVTAPAGVTEAIALVRWQGAGTVALSVGGTAAEQVRERETVNADGIPCRETEFLIAVSDRNLTVRVDLTNTGELDLFDYGLIWK